MEEQNVQKKWTTCDIDPIVIFLELFIGEANLQNMASWLYQIRLQLYAGWAQIIFQISKIYLDTIKQDTVSESLDIKLKLVKFNLASVWYMHCW